MAEISLEELRDTLRLEELLTDLGLDRVRSTVTGWQNQPCPLPTHLGHDVNASFGINEEWLTFKCFACDESGSIIKLAMILKEIEYEESLEYVVGFSDLTLDEWDEDIVKHVERIRTALERDINKPRRTRVVELPYFSPRAMDDFPVCPLEQLRKWQIQKSYTVQVFDLRYEDEHTRAEYTGPAILIPHKIGGDLVGWQERWLAKDVPDWLPKYTNTGEFPRKETLYNQDRALALGDPVLVVESVMTVIRLFELGYTATATFGGSVSEEQLAILRQMPMVVLAYDNDSTGRKADRKLSEYLSDYTDVFKVPFPPGTKADLADLPEETVHQLIDSAKHYTEVL